MYIATGMHRARESDRSGEKGRLDDCGRRWEFREGFLRSRSAYRRALNRMVCVLGLLLHVIRIRTGRESVGRGAWTDQDSVVEAWES